MNEILNNVKEYFHNKSDEQNVALIKEIINLAVYERVNYAVDSSDLIQSIYGKTVKEDINCFCDEDIIRAVIDRGINITKIYDNLYIHDVALENEIVTSDDFKDELYDEVKRLIEDGDCSVDKLFDDSEIIEYINWSYSVDDVFDEYDIKDYVKESLYPEEIYNDEELKHCMDRKGLSRTDNALDSVIDDLQNGKITLGDLATKEEIADYLKEHVSLADVADWK